MTVEFQYQIHCQSTNAWKIFVKPWDKCKIPSGVLPTHTAVLQGDVLRGKLNPFASATPGLHTLDTHLWESSKFDVKITVTLPKS